MQLRRIGAMSEEKVWPKELGPEPQKPQDTLTLSISSPLDSAVAFVKAKCRDEDGNVNLHFWQGQFYQWSGHHYRVVESEVIEREVMFFLNDCEVMEKGRRVRFQPKPAHVRDIMYCLEKCIVLDCECQPPAWLPEGTRAHHVIAFRNAAVNLQTGESVPLTPALWIHNVLNFDWDPEAKAPRWEQFLEEVFPNDSESQEFIEQWMGYCMTDEVKIHKGAMFIGKKRSGKGTITHIINALVGDTSYCSLNLNQWTSTENSQQIMIGKRVGVFPDVRLKPAKSFGFKGQSGYDAGGLSHQSQGLLLTLTSFDKLTIYRKMISAWSGILPIKIMMLSNEILNLNDSALSHRFIKIYFPISFFNREDINLLSKLQGELPGIAARCVAAYQRLCAVGRFIQPASGEALERAVLSGSDPMTAFMHENFVWNTDSIGTPKPVVRNMLNVWCSENGRMDLWNSTPEKKMGERISAVEGFENLNLSDYRPTDPMTGKQGSRRWQCVDVVHRRG